MLPSVWQGGKQLPKYMVTRAAIPDAVVVTRWGVIVVDLDAGVFVSK